jgi:purine-binding chemotaxis protein CheW
MDSVMEKQLVIFELGKENFGIDISTVESIVKMQEITKIPHSPEFVEGVTSHRGSILPVIDMGKRFGNSKGEWDKDTRIVVVNSLATKVGMIVAAVSEVMTIDESSIEPTPQLISTVNSKYISGIAHLGSRLIILLNLDLVLSKEEVTSLSEISK